MPLEQIGNSLLFGAYYTNSGLRATGLTVTVNIWEMTMGAVNTKIVNGAAATEVGDGQYIYLLSSGSVDAKAVYGAVFITADSCDQQEIGGACWVVGSVWVENVDAAISTRTKPADTQARVTLVDTTTTNVDMRGTDNAATAAALASVDSNVDAILADTNELQTDDVPGLIAALPANIVVAILAGAIEGTLDLKEVLRIMLSFASGTTAGANTTNPTFKAQDGLTDRIDMTVDSDGERSAVTVDGS